MSFRGRATGLPEGRPECPWISGSSPSVSDHCPLTTDHRYTWALDSALGGQQSWSGAVCRRPIPCITPCCRYRRAWAKLSRHLTRTWFGIGCAALLATIAGLAVAPPPDEALAQSATTGSVQGSVVDSAGAPVAGALVRSTGLGLTASTNASGRFTWSGIPAPAYGLPTTIEVLADGFGSWTIRDVLVLPNDTLLLEVELGADPVDIQVPPPRSGHDIANRTARPSAQAAVLGGATNPPIPATIRVRVTGYAYCDTSRPYTVQVVDFKDYVKHVLPNEWISSWPGEALRAGAMAAKMYAWTYIVDRRQVVRRRRLRQHLRPGLHPERLLRLH